MGGAMTAPSKCPARKSTDRNRITSGGSVTYSLAHLLDEVMEDEGIDLETREAAVRARAKIPTRKPRGMNKSRRWLLEE